MISREMWHAGEPCSARPFNGGTARPQRVRLARPATVLAFERVLCDSAGLSRASAAKGVWPSSCRHRGSIRPKGQLAMPSRRHTPCPRRNRGTSAPESPPQAKWSWMVRRWGMGMSLEKLRRFSPGGTRNAARNGESPANHSGVFGQQSSARDNGADQIRAACAETCRPSGLRRGFALSPARPVQRVRGDLDKSAGTRVACASGLAKPLPERDGAAFGTSQHSCANIQVCVVAAATTLTPRWN